MLHPECDKFDWPPPGTPLTLTEYCAVAGHEGGVVYQAEAPASRVFFGQDASDGFLNDTPGDYTFYRDAVLRAAYRAEGYTILQADHTLAPGVFCSHYWPLQEGGPEA